MVAGQIRSQISPASGHRRHAVLHLDRGRAAVDAAERDGAVVTAQAKSRRTVRLADDGFQRRAAVNDVIRHAGHVVIPQRRLAVRAMNGVTENANVAFGGSFDRSGTAYGQIVNGRDDAVCAKRRGKE